MFLCVDFNIHALQDSFILSSQEIPIVIISLIYSFIIILHMPISLIFLQHLDITTCRYLLIFERSARFTVKIILLLCVSCNISIQKCTIVIIQSLLIKEPQKHQDLLHRSNLQKWKHVFYYLLDIMQCILVLSLKRVNYILCRNKVLTHYVQ